MFLFIGFVNFDPNYILEMVLPAIVEYLYSNGVSHPSHPIFGNALSFNKNTFSDHEEYYGI